MKRTDKEGLRQDAEPLAPEERAWAQPFGTSPMARLPGLAGNGWGVDSIAPCSWGLQDTGSRRHY